jgi:O-antigen/teichoic acid export membrane protein
MSTSRLIGAFGTLAVAQMLVRIRALLMIPVLVKGLGVQAYGAWVLFVGAVNVLTAIISLGMPQALERFLAEPVSAREIRERFVSAFAVVGLAGVGGLVLAITAGQWLAVAVGSADISSLTVLIAWAVLATALNQLALMFFRAQREMGLMSALELLGGYSELAATAFVASRGLQLWDALLALVLARACTTAVALFIIVRRVGVGYARLQLVGACLAFGLPTVLTSLTYWMVEMSDRYFLGFFSYVGDVGTYSAAYGVGSLLSFPRMLLMLALPPFVYGLWDRGQHDTAHHYLRMSLKYYLLGAIPLGVGVSLLAAPILRVLAGVEVAERGQGVVVLIVLSMLLYGVSGITGLVFWVERKPRQLAGLWAAAAVINVLLNVMLIPPFGMIGAAVSTAVSYAVPAVVCMKAYVSRAGWGEWGFTGGVVGGIAAMTIVIYVANPSDLRGVAVTTLVAGTAYLAALLVTGSVQRRDFDFGERLST